MDRTPLSCLQDVVAKLSPDRAGTWFTFVLLFLRIRGFGNGMECGKERKKKTKENGIGRIAKEWFLVSLGDAPG